MVLSSLLQLPLSAFPQDRINTLTARIEKTYAGNLFNSIHLCIHLCTSVYFCTPLYTSIYFCTPLFTTSNCIYVTTVCHSSCTESVGELEVSVLEHPAMAGELRNAKNGPSALKHLRQQVSLFTHKCFSW